MSQSQSSSIYVQGTYNPMTLTCSGRPFQVPAAELLQCLLCNCCGALPPKQQRLSHEAAKVLDHD